MGQGAGKQGVLLEPCKGACNTDEKGVLELDPEA